MKLYTLFIISIFFCSSVFAQNCEGDSKSLWNNCFGTYNSWYGTYIGNFKNGKKHGEGTIHYYNGDKFVGEFKDGKKNGKGAFTYSSGETSSGNWQDDLYIGN